MNIIKISASHSTNTDLSDLSKANNLENFTVLSTYNQFQGRGQTGKYWFSDEGKNLSFSVYIRFEDLSVEGGSMINWQAALSVWDFLKMNQIEDLSIKWPNDILSDKKKIAGILIEPKIGQNSVKSAIIGVGLNVNQESFPDELSNATSILMARQRQTNLDLALDQILDCLRVRFENPELWNFESVKAEYESKLFNRNRVMVFEHLKDAYKFNAIIKGVDNNNLLVLELESGEKSSFDLQSLKWYY